MKQKQKLLIGIGLGVLILMNVFVLGWVLTDFLSGSNEPEKTVAVTDDGEDTTGGKPTEEVTTDVTIDEPITEEITTEEIPTEPPLPETEQVFEEVRCPVYNRYPGSGEYEIGYSVDALGGLTGPDSFAIEGENIAILDGVNDRIFRDGERYYYSRSISLKKFVYDRKKLSVSKITSVDDSSVVFEAFNGSDRMQYRYDSASKTIEPMSVAPEEQSIKIGEKTATVIGKVEDRTYYQYNEWDGQTETMVIGVQVENVGRWYVTQELSGYRTIPSDNLYVSQDGKLYLMECFEDQTVISELMLGEPVEEPTEEPTEDATKESTPYGEVLDEYFAKREVLYTSTEMPEIDPGWWQTVQRYMTSVGWKVLNAEMSYNIVEIISETETEVKLCLTEIAEITYLLDGYVKKEHNSIVLAHIIRLSKQDGTYRIVADSCYDRMRNYQSGLEEDIKLLKPSGGAVAG